MAARRLRRIELELPFCTLRISLPRGMSLVLPVAERSML